MDVLQLKHDTSRHEMEVIAGKQNSNRNPEKAKLFEVS